MERLEAPVKMLDNQGNLVRPNYKWLRRLGLQTDDKQYVQTLKRQRNQKKAKPTQAKRPKVTATVEDTNNYVREIPKPTIQQPILYTPQVRHHGYNTN